MLNPVNTWADPAAYNERARKLAREFAAHYEKAYGGKDIDPAVAAECPRG
jgi:phosphoenolpyruvate carboxykinase (ATP)